MTLCNNTDDHLIQFLNKRKGWRLTTGESQSEIDLMLRQFLFIVYRWQPS